jgi:hypothetical protein
MKFVVDKVAQGQVFSEDFGFFCLLSFHRLFYNHHYHDHHFSSGTGTVGQTMAAVLNALSLTP